MEERLRLLACLAGFILLTFYSNGQGIGEYDQHGWTFLEPSADSRVVYVSSSSGNDSNDGLSASTAKETIAAGDELIRDGFPDHLLLKRGDVFENASLGRWKNGRSKSEPMVASYYGETGDRPLLIITEPFIQLAAQPRSHVAVVGLEFYKSNSDPDSPDFDNSGCSTGIAVFPGTAGAENWLVEDCKFRYCWLAAQGNVENGSGFLRNVYVRRNMITRSWAHNSTSDHLGRIQGLFANDIENLYIEENFFDHCGWNDQIEDANANQFNHDIYIQRTCFGDIILKGNILMRGSAHGVQLRSGGTARHNVMINNAIGMNIGYTSPPEYNTQPTLVADNVVTDGRPQIPNDTEFPQTGAIWGFWKQLIDDVTVEDNIVANMLDNRGGNMYPFKDFEDDNANALGDGNIAWNWERNDFPTESSHSDPNRNIASFASLKELDGLEGYSQLHLNRPLKTYTYELSAYEYLNYIREGFGKTSDLVSDFSFTGEVDPEPLGTKALRRIFAYPNPTSSTIKLENLPPNSEVSILSMSGRVVLKSVKVESNLLDLSKLESGMYLLKVLSDFEVTTLVRIRRK